MQEELGLTVYAPVGCRGLRGVRLVGLERSGVTEQSPFDAIIIVTNHEVEGGEHGYESALELQESITSVDRGPVGGTERGSLGLGREGEGLVVGRHSRLRPSTLQPGGKKEKKFSTSLEFFRANLKKNLMRWVGRRSAELSWTPLDAWDHAGPATLDLHGGCTTRRLGVTGP